MIELKGRKSRGVLKAEASGVGISEEEPNKPTRRPRDVLSAHSHSTKRAKTTSVVATENKEPPTAAACSVAGSIKIGGGVVDCQGLDKALRALCRHVQKLQQQEETPDLLAGSGGPTVCLMFSLQNIPDKQRVIPHLIELPYSPLDAGSEVCLIVRDPQRKWKDLVAASSSLSAVTRVISYRKLPKKFPQFADKRALCAAYDQFLVDTNVKEKAYNSLGRVFFSANKLPLPIRVGVTTLEREVGRAMRCTSLVIKRGPSVAVRIGKALTSPDELYANAVAAIKGVSDFFQQKHKWKNTVTTIHIQATNTPALPVYMHPKYLKAAELYCQTSPPSASTETQLVKNEKKQKEAQEVLKTPNRARDGRKIKRGVNDKHGKMNGGKKSMKKSFKKHEVKSKKQK